MKLIVSLLLCFFVGVLADHKHPPFADDIVPKIEAKLNEALMSFKLIGPKQRRLETITLEDDVKENDDEHRISLRLRNASTWNLKGKWDITRTNENQLTIKAVITQTDMRHAGDVVITETQLAGPGEIKGTIVKHPVDIIWNENSGKVNLTLNNINGDLSIENLKTEIIVPYPEVQIATQSQTLEWIQTKPRLEQLVARVFRDQYKTRSGMLEKEGYLADFMHELLRAVEYKGK